MLNSVKAFLIGKQKACKIVKTTEKVDIIVEKDLEKEEADQQRQSELYEIMISMAEAKLDINDIKTFIGEERKLRDQRNEEERKLLKLNNKNRSKNTSMRLASVRNEQNSSFKPENSPSKNNLDSHSLVDQRDKRTTSPMFMGRDTKTNWNKDNKHNNNINKKELLEVGDGNISIKSPQPRAKSSNGIKRDTKDTQK